MSDLTKATLVKKLSEKLGVSQKNADEALEAVMNVIKDSVQTQGTCRISGFGRFELRPVKEKTIKAQGITKRMADMVIPAHNRFVFRPAKPLKEAFAHVVIPKEEKKTTATKAAPAPAKKTPASKKA